MLTENPRSQGGCGAVQGCWLGTDPSWGALEVGGCTSQKFKLLTERHLHV